MITHTPSLRINLSNPNHHLFCNNGRNWWLHYTQHLSNYTTQRIRVSLGTADLNVARKRRDAAISHLSHQAALGLTASLPSYRTEGRAA